MPPLTLASRTLALLRRHGTFYLVIAVAVISAIWVIERATSNVALVFASSIVLGSILDATVIARTKADVDGVDSMPWSLVLERAWAVVIVNFIISMMTLYAMQLVASGEIGREITGALTITFAVALIFAETIAVVADEEHWQLLLVTALGGSVRIAWHGANMWLAILLFSAAQLLPLALQTALAVFLKSHHVASASFWGNVPLGILLMIPFDVAIALAFLDISGYEPKLPCGE